MIGGFGRSRQQETTHITGESETKTPWRVFLYASLVDAIVSFALFAILLLVVWWVAGLIIANTPSYPVITFWRAAWRGLLVAGRWARVLIIVPMVSSLACLVYHGRTLVHYRYVPEQINRNYPPVYKEAEPETAGTSFWDSWDNNHPREQPEPEQVLMPPVSIENEHGEWSDPELPPMPAVDGPRKLLLFLRAVRCGARPFSRDGALRDPKIMGRRDFDRLAAWLADPERRFHEKGSGMLTNRGKRWANLVINRLVPDNGHSPGLPDVLDNATERVLSRPARPVPTEVGE